MQYSKFERSTVYALWLKVSIAYLALVLRQYIKFSMALTEQTINYPNMKQCVPLKHNATLHDLNANPECLLVKEVDKFLLYKYVSDIGGYAEVRFLSSDQNKVDKILSKLHRFTRKRLHLATNVYEDKNGVLHVAQHRP